MLSPCQQNVDDAALVCRLLLCVHSSQPVIMLRCFSPWFGGFVVGNVVNQTVQQVGAQVLGHGSVVGCLWAHTVVYERAGAEDKK